MSLGVSGVDVITVLSRHQRRKWYHDVSQLSGALHVEGEVTAGLAVGLDDVNLGVKGQANGSVLVCKQADVSGE